MQERGHQEWRRPTAGRRISGVCALLSRRSRVPVAAARAGMVAAALAGLALLLAFGIFDAALLGEPAAPALRVPAIALGALLLFLYPLLALVFPDERRPWGWDFGSSLGAVLLLVPMGQAFGILIEPYWNAAEAAWRARGASGFVTWPSDYLDASGLGARDVLFALLVLSTLGFLWLQRAAVKRFFRSMNTGVTLVSLTTLAVAAGVLVPQIDGFEDPEQRVDLAREEADYRIFQRLGYQKLPAAMQDGHEQYEAFRWAEGYFLYHLLHLYGIGMPEAALPPRIDESLAAFGDRYGVEERDNRQKQMLASFSGRETIGEIGDFIHRNEASFWRFFQLSTWLQLNRAYKSHWFASLLFLLGTAVFFNTFKGSPKRWFGIQKLGWFVVHTGMMTLLLGGFVSKLFTDRGILQLDLRLPPEDTYWRHYDPSKKARMPFAVRLDRFARQDWKALEVHFLEEDFQSRLPRYTLWEGREIDLDYVDDELGQHRPRIRLRVRELYDRVQVDLPNVREAPEGSNAASLPIADLKVHAPHPGHHDDEDHGQRQYLTPVLPSTALLFDPAGDFRLYADYADGGRAPFPAAEGVLGRIEATVAGGEEAAPHVVEVSRDQELALAGGYRLRIVGATADFDRGHDDDRGSRHPLPLEAQPRGQAAIWVDVVPPSADEPVERRLVLDGIDPREHGMQEAYAHPEVLVRFAWDAWSAPGPPRFVLRWGREGTPTLIAQDGEQRPAPVGEALALPGDTRVVPLQYLHRGLFEKNLEFLPPRETEGGFDADFYANTPRGLLLDAVHDPDTSRERTETLEMATTEYAQSNVWMSGDDRFALVFLENSEMLPYEWRSVLSIIETDNAGRPYEVPLGSEAEREIRVNDYFRYGGYRFFQTNARADMPTYSGIGVVYDPGIPIVLAGMYIIIAGTVIAFLIRPVVLARRNKESRS